MILESKLAWTIKEVVDDFLSDAFFRLVIGTGYRRGPVSNFRRNEEMGHLTNRHKFLWVRLVGNPPGQGTIKSVRWSPPHNTRLNVMNLDNLDDPESVYIPYCHENKGENYRSGL